MAACTPSLAVESRGSWNSGKQTPMGGVATSAAGVVSSMRGVVSGNSGPFRAISGGAAGLPSALFHSNKPSRTLITSSADDRPTWRLRPARCRAPAGGRRPRFGRLATVGVLVEHLELLVWSSARQALDLGEGSSTSVGPRWGVAGGHAMSVQSTSEKRTSRQLSGSVTCVADGLQRAGSGSVEVMVFIAPLPFIWMSPRGCVRRSPVGRPAPSALNLPCPYATDAEAASGNRGSGQMKRYAYRVVVFGVWNVVSGASVRDVQAYL